MTRKAPKTWGDAERTNYGLAAEDFAVTHTADTFLTVLVWSCLEAGETIIELIR